MFVEPAFVASADTRGLASVVRPGRSTCLAKTLHQFCQPQPFLTFE